MNGADYYDTHAAKVFAEYQSYNSDALHAIAKPHVKTNSRVLDVGAGSGRDAAWYRGLGASVTAVEAAHNLLILARDHYADAGIEWVHDALPHLASLGGRTFDLIQMAGVWMHVAPGDRVAALDRLYALLAPGGHLFCTIRHGADTKGRGLFDTPDDDPIWTDPRFVQVYHDRQDVFRYDTPTVWTQTIFKKQ